MNLFHLHLNSGPKPLKKFSKEGDSPQEELLKENKVQKTSVYPPEHHKLPLMVRFKQFVLKIKLVEMIPVLAAAKKNIKIATANKPGVIG